MLVQQEYHRAIYSPSPKLRLSARSKLNPAARPAYLHTIRRKPLPTRNSISLFSMEGKRTIFCREGNIITSSLEGQERRMNGHPWPTATPHCKTLSSYWAHAHEFTCAPITLRRHHTHTNTHTHTRLVDISIVGGRNEWTHGSTHCRASEQAAVWSLVAFHPRGLVAWPCPSMFGERLSPTNHVERGGRGCFQERDQPRGGIRGGFRCPLSFLFA